MASNRRFFTGPYPPIATHSTLPGASFVVNCAALAHDAALVAASAEKKWLNGWSACCHRRT
jgi:hypothetical protein